MKTIRAALIPTTVLLIGCVSDDSREHQTVTHRPDGITEVATPAPPGLARQRATRRNERMVYEERVPSTATEIGQPMTLTDGPRRADAVLVARPPSNGEVWLVESATGRILYAGYLRQGDSLLVNLTRNEVSLNTQPLSAVQIDGSRDYKVYFLAR